MQRCFCLRAGRRDGVPGLLARPLPRLAVAVIVCATLAASPARAALYSVGPGQPLASIGAVPWATLQPGDRVEIHWSATPYREKWVLNRRGTAAQPIEVVGIPGPGGARPVIAGDGAVTAPGLNFWNEPRGLLKIGGSNTPTDGLPGHLVIEGLEFRSARPPFTFTDDGGSSQTYSDNAAAIYVEKAEFLTIRDCLLTDSGNGLFIGAFDGETRHIRLLGNVFTDNGIVGSIFQHNTYTAAIDLLYEGNRFGPLRSGAGGNNLKDRSAGLVVRANWIEGGNRQLDLVDAEDSAVLVADPSYRETHVYGNVLIEPDGDGNSQIVHYGGDSGNTAIYRKGRLFFFHNTVISLRTGNTTLLRLSTNDEAAEVWNNVLYTVADGTRMALLNAAGDLVLRRNWLKPGWADSHSGLTGTLDDDGSSVLGADPGFVDAGTGDYRPAAASPLLDAAWPLPASIAAAHQPRREPAPPLGSAVRPVDGAADLGAFERCDLAPCAPAFGDSFESGDLQRWTTAVP